MLNSGNLKVRGFQTCIWEIEDFLGYATDAEQKYTHELEIPTDFILVFNNYCFTMLCG